MTTIARRPCAEPAAVNLLQLAVTSRPRILASHSPDPQPASLGGRIDASRLGSLGRRLAGVWKPGDQHALSDRDYGCERDHREAGQAYRRDQGEFGFKNRGHGKRADSVWWTYCRAKRTPGLTFPNLSPGTPNASSAFRVLSMPSPR